MIGFDYLGLGSKYFNVQAARDLTPKGSAIGCFDSTFGDAVPNLKLLLDTGKFPVARVHIGWSSSHIIIPISVIRPRLPVYEALALAYPKVKFYLSHSCEHSCANAAQAQQRMQMIRLSAPHCIPVNCPGTGVLLPNAVNEHHDPDHALAGKYITSMDGCCNGNGAWNVDIKRWVNTHSRAVASFIWIPEFNGRTPNEKKAPQPPTERRVFATPEQIKMLVNYVR